VDQQRDRLGRRTDATSISTELQPVDELPTVIKLVHLATIGAIVGQSLDAVRSSTARHLKREVTDGIDCIQTCLALYSEVKYSIGIATMRQRMTVFGL
jgi:hypothetical protein